MIQILQKQERSRKEQNFIIQQISSYHFFASLFNNQKLYQTTLKIFAEKATLVKYQKGSLLSYQGLKQEYLSILISGKVQQYCQITEDELKIKKNQFKNKYQEFDHLFIYKPGRRILYEYQENDEIKIIINDTVAKRRSLIYDIQPINELTLLRSSSVITKGRCNILETYVPPELVQEISQEMQILLNNVKLLYDHHIQYFFQDLIVSQLQGDLYSPGDLLNQNLKQKKYNNILVAQTDIAIMQLSIEQYNNIEENLKLHRQTKIINLLNQALLGKDYLEDQNFIIKILINNYTIKKLTQNNIVYKIGDLQKNIYIVKQGEFQLSTQGKTIIAKITEGCLLGEESFSKGKYTYECTTISSKCKLIVFNISDFMFISSRFSWFKTLMQNKEIIKDHWLRSRIKEQNQFTKKLHDHLHAFQEEKNLIRELLLPKESTPISQFQRLKKGHFSQRTTRIHTSEEIKEQSKIKISPYKLQFKKQNNIFDNETLCEFGIGKKFNNDASTITTKIINHQESTEQSSREINKFQMLRRVQRATYNSSSQPKTSRASIEVDVIPMMMSMNKNQLQFLKTVISDRKGSTDLTSQKSAPILATSLFQQRIIRRNG